MVLLSLSYSVISNSFVTLWTIARQAPLSMGFSREEYWSGLPFPSPGALSDPGTETRSPALTGGLFTTEPPGKPRMANLFILEITIHMLSALLWSLS